MCDCPVVHRELCIPRLDVFSRVQLLKLFASVITKRVLSRHDVWLSDTVIIDSWLGRDTFFTPL